jgi:hypothetical protein
MGCEKDRSLALREFRSQLRLQALHRDGAVTEAREARGNGFAGTAGAAN